MFSLSLNTPQNRELNLNLFQLFIMEFNLQVTHQHEGEKTTERRKKVK